jgi:phytoene desaturase
MSEPRVAIIGAGFGGLAAALRLRAAGVATALFEARDGPGGRAYVYRDRGFTFDAGPTVIRPSSRLHRASKSSSPCRTSRSRTSSS